MSYLKRIEIKNFGGVENFSANLGAVAIVTGTNGQGKSSLLNSLRSVFEGGGDTSLIRNGSKKAEASIEFGNGYKAVKVIEPTKFTLTVFDDLGGKITSPATKLAEFIPKDTFSVQELLEAEPKDLTALMLKYLPMNFSPEEVNKALRAPTLQRSIALGEFNALRKTQYDKRTDINRSVRDLQGTLAQMESALSADDETNWTKERDGLDNAIAGCDAEIVELKRGIDEQKLAFVDEKRKHKDAAIEVLRKQIADLEASFAKLTNDADQMASDEFATARVAVDQKRAKLVEERGATSAKADQQQRAVGIRNAIAAQKKNLDGSVTQETILTSILEDMDTLKALKLKSLPIDGLDIEMDGKNPIIKIHGIPLDRLNAQAQLYAIVKFIAEAQEGAGCAFKVIVCEGAELVPTKLIAMAEACMEAGIQLICTMPIDGAPLRVMNLDEYKASINSKIAVGGK